MTRSAQALWRASFGRSQFLRFALVGIAGYVVDAGVLTLLVEGIGLDPYSARVASFVCAATATWWLNRRFTFAASDKPAAGRQWARFLLVNAFGAAINYGAYVIALQSWPLAMDYPALAAAIGSIAGLAFNFPASKFLVFRTGLPAPSQPPFEGKSGA